MVIDIWRGMITEIGDATGIPAADLSERERARASRLEGERARSYLVTQAVLRRVLAHYVGIRPAEIRFEYGRRGKPHLPPSAAKEALHFNMSHSSDLVAVAVTRFGEVGLDVERARILHNGEAVARRFFSVAERAEIEAADENDRHMHFVQAWTRYEARVKKIGGNMWNREAAADPRILTRDVRIADGYGCSVAADIGKWGVELREISDLWSR